MSKHIKELYHTQRSLKLHLAINIVYCPWLTFTFMHLFKLSQKWLNMFRRKSTRSKCSSPLSSLIFSSRSVNKYACPDSDWLISNSHIGNSPLYSLSAHKSALMREYGQLRPLAAVLFSGSHVYLLTIFPPISCPTLTMFKIQINVVHIVKCIYTSKFAARSYDQIYTQKQIICYNI